MKNVLCACLALCLLLGAASCGTKPAETESVTATESATVAETTSVTDTESEPVTDTVTETETETVTETATETATETESVTETETLEPLEADDTHVLLVRGTKAACCVVSAAKNPVPVDEAVGSVRNGIWETAGAMPKAKTAGYEVPEDMIPIYVGTGASAEAEALAAQLVPHEFCVSVTKTAVTLVAADNEALTRAVTYFLDVCLQGEDVVCEQGRGLAVPLGEYHSSVDGYDLVTRFEASDTVTPEITMLLRLSRPVGTVNIMQGGYCDGTYYYGVYMKDIKDDASQDVYVGKVLLATGENVASSEALHLAHGNDVTYNSKTGQLIVVNGSPEAKVITFLDPETLAVTGTKTLDFKIYCMDYCAEKNQYVVGLSGGQTFCVLDENFDAVGEPFAPTERTADCITQGCSCDENYVYFVLYEPDYIAVYDWDGNFVTLLDLAELPEGAEPENVSVRDGVVYVATQSGRTGTPMLFQITPHP